MREYALAVKILVKESMVTEAFACPLPQLPVVITDNALLTFQFIHTANLRH